MKAVSLAFFKCRLAYGRLPRYTLVLVSRRRRPYGSGTGQPELPLAARKQRPRVLEPEVAARVAIARRAKPSGIPGDVKLVLTLELRRELAEKLSQQAIRSGRNIETIVIGSIDATAKKWQ